MRNGRNVAACGGRTAGVKQELRDIIFKTSPRAPAWRSAVRPMRRSPSALNPRFKSSGLHLGGLSPLKLAAPGKDRYPIGLHVPRYRMNSGSPPVATCKSASDRRVRLGFKPSEALAARRIAAIHALGLAADLRRLAAGPPELAAAGVRVSRQRVAPPAERGRWRLRRG